MSINDLVAAAEADGIVSSSEDQNSAIEITVSPASSSHGGKVQSIADRTRLKRKPDSSKLVLPTCDSQATLPRSTAASQPLSDEMVAFYVKQQIDSARNKETMLRNSDQLVQHYMKFFMTGFISDSIPYCLEPHNVATRELFATRFWGCIAARSGQWPKLECFAQASRGVNDSFFVADSSLRIETGEWCDADRLILTHSWQSAQVQDALVQSCTYASWAAHNFHVLETMFLAREADCSSQSKEVRNNPCERLPWIDRWSIVGRGHQKVDRSWICNNFPSLRLYLTQEHRNLHAITYTIVTARGCKELMKRNKLNDSLIAVICNGGKSS